jgi:SsrA-binding protein
MANLSKTKTKKAPARPTIQNRKASYDFEFIETFNAGIALSGPEIKSIRAGKVQLLDSFCAFDGNELILRNVQISPYTEGSYNNPVDPKRPRKLLLTRKELRQLKKAVAEKGLTIVPVKLFFNERNFCKALIALARGKKAYDKRESIKNRDIARQTRRELD